MQRYECGYIQGFYMQHNLSHAKVLVVGDIMLDRYYNGSTERISPEAPVPVVHVKSIQNRAGGAGNVALNVASLSAKASICSMVGNDAEAHDLARILSDENIDQHFIKTDKPTITKVRVLSQKQQLIRVDFEENFLSEDKAKILDFIDASSGYNTMVLSDYGKGTLSDPQSIIKLAKKKGIKIFVDPKGNDFSRYKGASVITPNRKEFELVVGECHTEKDIIDKGAELVKILELDGILVTRSAEGMSFIRHDGTYEHIPTIAKEVYDVTGAGDTVIAVMAMAISVGYDYLSAMRLANAAASVVVGKVGTATVNINELHDALDEQSVFAHGVLSQKELLTAMKEVHLQGEKVVMTNGCFDILHAGHVEYLQKARSLGDRLIVAVNTDESVTRLKGSARPVVPLEARMEVLSALQCVDWVVAFSEDTPQRLISEVLPDILVKGADYEVNEIAGAKEVIENGGEVKTIDLKPNYSTSYIINKIKSEA